MGEYQDLVKAANKHDKLKRICRVEDNTTGQNFVFMTEAQFHRITSGIYKNAKEEVDPNDG